MHPFIIIFFFLAVLLNIFFNGKTISSKYLDFFKFFFPSWCFFDGCSQTPQLFYKNKDVWQLAISPSNIKLKNLFFNPDHNLYLAYHSQVQMLIDEIYANQNNTEYKIENSVNYKLISEWAKHLSHSDKNYQFKIANFNEDILVSPIYDC